MEIKENPRFITVGSIETTCYLIDVISDTFVTQIAATYVYQVNRAITRFISEKGLTERQFADNYSIEQTLTGDPVEVDAKGDIIFKYNFKIKKIELNK